MDAKCPACGSTLNRLYGKDGHEVIIDAAGIPKNLPNHAIYACVGCEFVFKLPTGVW